MRFAATTIAIATAFLALASASPDLVVDTKFGQLRGADEGTYSAFKGVPYAASTAGENRWTAPKDPEPWEDVRDATEFGNICLQATQPPYNLWDIINQEWLGRNVPSTDPATYTMDEDCLVLNVYTPNVTGNLPVMVFIPGGNLKDGSGQDLPAEGLVGGDDVILVTMNYRLGFLGYFAHPELNATNFGLLDQVKALEWVQENIASFGGDPDNVTVFGESAGATSVLALMASPLAEGLFTNAISESAVIFESVNVTKEEAGDLGLAVQKFVNATDIDQMRSVPAEAYVQAFDNFLDSPWANVSLSMANLYTDNASLPMPIAEAFKQGALLKGVNLMVGFNKNDGGVSAPYNLDGYHSFVETAFGGNQSNAQRVLELIPASTDDEAGVAMAEYMTSFAFGNGAYEAAKANAKGEEGNTFLYMFDYTFPADPEVGTIHGADLPFVFNYSPAFNNTTMGREIPTYWTNFAKTGNPNGGSLPNWPAFEEGSDSWQVLGENISNQPIPKDKMEVWELVNLILPANYIVGTGPIIGTNYTWSLEDGVPSA